MEIAVLADQCTILLTLIRPFVDPCALARQDFSEDTYRTLAAADNAVMLVDAAKGLEPQTRKLFEVGAESVRRVEVVMVFENSAFGVARGPCTK